jgi:hypothetical protein
LGNATGASSAPIAPLPHHTSFRTTMAMKVAASLMGASPNVIQHPSYMPISETPVGALSFGPPTGGFDHAEIQPAGYDPG